MTVHIQSNPLGVFFRVDADVGPELRFSGVAGPVRTAYIKANKL